MPFLPTEVPDTGNKHVEKLEDDSALVPEATGVVSMHALFTQHSLIICVGCEELRS